MVKTLTPILYSSSRGILIASLILVTGCNSAHSRDSVATQNMAEVLPCSSAQKSTFISAYKQSDIDLRNYEGCTPPAKVQAKTVQPFNSHRIDGNEFLDYTVVVEKSGFFNVHYRLAENSGAVIKDSQFSLSVNGTQMPGIIFPVAAKDASTVPPENKTLMYLSDGPQTLRLRALSGGATLAALEFSYSENPQLTPAEIVSAMGVGINLGNTLDAIPNEGSWAPAAQPEYFVAYKKAGFKHVRIPVTWAFHQDETVPYSVIPARMNRVEEVVDWALAHGFYVILNAHHEKWFKEDYKNPIKQARFDALWLQISDRFKSKSPRLLFEILNEPVGMTPAEVDELNPRILNIMRAYNPTRAVIFSGHQYTTIDDLLITAIPSPSDKYLIGNFHSYNPWPFAGTCVQKWGSPQDYKELENIYVRAKAWSDAKGIPVTVNEFGVTHFDQEKPENVCDPKERLAYLKAVVKFASERGIAATVWDDNNAFGVYNRKQATWGPEKDIIVAPNLQTENKTPQAAPKK